MPSETKASMTAFLVAYDRGAKARRAGHPARDNPYEHLGDLTNWRNASAWRQGYRDMAQMLDDARDLAE